MKVSEAKKLARLSKWQQLVNQQRASGLSIRCWCEQNALTEQQFYYRLRQVREAVLDKIESCSDVQLVRLPEIETPTALVLQRSQSSIIVRHGTTSIEFSPDSDMQQIAQFVRSLEP